MRRMRGNKSTRQHVKIELRLIWRLPASLPLHKRLPLEGWIVSLRIVRLGADQMSHTLYVYYVYVREKNKMELAITPVGLEKLVLCTYCNKLFLKFSILLFFVHWTSLTINMEIPLWCLALYWHFGNTFMNEKNHHKILRKSNSSWVRAWWSKTFEILSCWFLNKIQIYFFANRTIRIIFPKCLKLCTY